MPLQDQLAHILGLVMQKLGMPEFLQMLGHRHEHVASRIKSIQSGLPPGMFLFLLDCHDCFYLIGFVTVIHDDGAACRLVRAMYNMYRNIVNSKIAMAVTPVTLWFVVAIEAE